MNRVFFIKIIRLLTELAQEYYDRNCELDGSVFINKLFSIILIRFRYTDLLEALQKQIEDDILFYSKISQHRVNILKDTNFSIGRIIKELKNNEL